MASSTPLIGSLRHYVSLWEDRGDVRGEHNLPTAHWVRVANFYASIEPVGGREFFQAQQVQSSVTYRIRCRWLPGVRPQQQIRYGTRCFDIQSVLDAEERNEWLEIMAVEHSDG